MPRKANAKKAPHSTNIFFENNDLLPMLYGDGDAHLKKLESMLDVEVVPHGNMVSVSGNKRDVVISERILMQLYDQIESGVDVTEAEVAAAIRMAPPVTDAEVEEKPKRKAKAAQKRETGGDVVIKTMKKTIRPYSHMQANYIRSLYDSDLVFALGPAGTGKTYIAMAMAIYMFLNKKVERIVLSRPAVEAGEKLGFLPGDVKEKIDPFLRPLYDALFDMMPSERVVQMSETGEIEVAPLAFMRGRTISNAFVILDEAQNTTPTQMKMFLTRLGENSRMVITGDLTQVDLPKDVKSGLRDSVRKIEHIEGIDVIRFSDGDVVRHPLQRRSSRPITIGITGCAPRLRRRKRMSRRNSMEPVRMMAAAASDSEIEVVVSIHDKRWQTVFEDAESVVTQYVQTLLETLHDLDRAELAVVLTDDKEIAVLNETYRGKAKPTNVLSFPAGEETHEIPGLPLVLGDVILSYDTICREAEEQGKSAKDHAVHMMTHGVLHLLGYDHESEADAEVMESEEIRLLAEWGIPNPYVIH